MNHTRMIIGAGPMKKIARQKLKGHWLESAAVFIVFTLFSQGLNRILVNNNDINTSVEHLLDNNNGHLLTITTVLGIATLLLAPPFLVGAMKYILNIVRDNNPKFSDIFYGFTCYWRSFKQYFLFNLVIGLPVIILIAIALAISSAISQRVDSLLLSFMVIIILLLLVWIVYAIVMQIGLFFKYFVIADEKFKYNGAIDSLKVCYSMMSGNKAHLFGTMISFIGWYLLAVLPGSILIAASMTSGSSVLIWGNLLTVIPMSFVYAYSYVTFGVYYRILMGELKIDIVDEEPQEINNEFFNSLVHEETHIETAEEIPSENTAETQKETMEETPREEGLQASEDGDIETNLQGENESHDDVNE